MVHKNIHDKDIDESLQHENGLAVLAFRFEIVTNDDDRFKQNEAVDHLSNITFEHLIKLGSKFEEKGMICPFSQILSYLMWWL